MSRVYGRHADRSGLGQSVLRGHIVRRARGALGKKVAVSISLRRSGARIYNSIPRMTLSLHEILQVYSVICTQCSYMCT